MNDAGCASDWSSSIWQRKKVHRGLVSWFPVPERGWRIRAPDLLGSVFSSTRLSEVPTSRVLFHKPFAQAADRSPQLHFSITQLSDACHRVLWGPAVQKERKIEPIRH